MTVSYLEAADTKAHKDIDIASKQRSLMVSEWESSPSGVDWEMIRSMRRIGRYKEDEIE